MIALPAEVTFATAPQVLEASVRALDAALLAGGSRAAGASEPGQARSVSAPAVGTGASAVASGGSTAGAIEIDLTGCGAFDSSMLAVLLELARRAQAAGASYRVLSPPDNLRKLAALYGVDELLFAPR